MVEKCLLSYKHLMGWFFTSLDVFYLFFILIFVAGMVVVVVQEVITLYGCEMIIILYPVF